MAESVDLTFEERLTLIVSNMGRYTEEFQRTLFMEFVAIFLEKAVVEQIFELTSFFGHNDRAS